MKKLPLSQSKYALLDDKDFAKVSKYKWCVAKRKHHFHVMRTVIEDGKKKTQYLHQFLMSPAEGMVVDHINGNGLDNRKENLRVCTQQQNVWNSRANTRNISGYKGVSFEETTGKWRARLRKDGKSYSLGLFEKAEDASKAYQTLAKELFGEFATLN